MAKKTNNELSYHKRRSQTYHANFKDKEDGFRRSKSKRSRKSKRLSNPFLPASSKLMSSSTSKDAGDVQFHIVGELANNKHYVTQKAVNLKSGKPLVIKYFKVRL